MLGRGLVLTLIGLVMVVVILVRFGFLQLMSWIFLTGALAVAPALAIAAVVVTRSPRWKSVILIAAGVLAAGGFGYAWWGFGVGFDAAENQGTAPPLSDHWMYGGYTYAAGTALLLLTLTVGGTRGRRVDRQPAGPAPGIR